jgi:hypothetical protein
MGSRMSDDLYFAAAMSFSDGLYDPIGWSRCVVPRSVMKLIMCQVVWAGCTEYRHSSYSLSPPEI